MIDMESCLVWDIPDETGGRNRYSKKVAEFTNSQIYSYNITDSINNDELYNEIKSPTAINTIFEHTLIKEIYELVQYASWRPPSECNTLITRGSKSLHTVQRLDQHHIHIIDGSYRGLFLHGHQYDIFKMKHPISQFILGLNRLAIRSFVQSSMHTVDTIVANSEYTKSIVESLYNREVDSVIYPPVNTTSLEPAKQADKNFYLYMGGVDAHHRIRELVKAFNQIDEQLIIAGKGDLLDEMRSISRDNIIFKGYVKGEAKRRLLSNCRALISTARHSFGRVFIEALASGRPIISVRLGYAPILLKHGCTGLLYDCGVQNLVRAVESFDDYEWDTGELVELANKYSEEEVEARWKSLIQNTARNE